MPSAITRSSEAWLAIQGKPTVRVLLPQGQGAAVVHLDLWRGGRKRRHPVNQLVAPAANTLGGIFGGKDENILNKSIEN